jgi:threonine dehydrogenase-like Zn-dependent dehydrogenase
VLHAALKSARRGGTVSISGVYGGEMDPVPMMEVFDRQIQIRMGQANVHRWIPQVLPLVEDPADPLGVMDLTTHQLPLDEAPGAYEMFQKKEDGCIKVVLKP